MMNVLVSNGYVFWSALVGAIVLCTVCLRKGDFSRKWYSSRWGTFLARHSFGLWALSFLLLFILCAIGSLIYYNKLAEPMLDTVLKSLVIVNGLLMAGSVISLVFCYCRRCWGEMPLGHMLGWTIPLSLLSGAILLVSHPSIPDGAISSSLWSALKLNMNDDTMSWFGNIGIYRFGTYVDIMRNPAYQRMVGWFLAGVCTVHILLCNGWMHCNKLLSRFLYPVLASLIVFLVVPVSVAVGFIVCAWAIFGAVVVVYIVAGLFMLGLLFAFISGWISQEFGSSGRGRLSDGTKMRQICGSHWEDEHGNKWTNTGGNSFERD